MSVLPGTMLHSHRAVDLDQKKKSNSSLKKNLVDGLRKKRFSKIPGYSPVIQEINL